MDIFNGYLTHTYFIKIRKRDNAEKTIFKGTDFYTY